MGGLGGGLNDMADGLGGGMGGGFGLGAGANVNFNHPDYQFIRNLYIGIINDKKKDNINSYGRNNFGGNIGQDCHGIDIIRNLIVGGYLFFSGTAT